MGRRIVPAGSRAVMVELDDLDQAVRFNAALLAANLPGVTEIIPAARTVLVEFESAAQTGAIVAELKGLPLADAVRVDADPLVIPTIYDGADLNETADHLGVSTDELVRRHTEATWTVAFVGFAPGFAYQVCDDPLFNVPRRSSPRTRIPAGSVGLAGEFSGVYPRESPGGWQLIGRTPLAMFDVTRDPAVLLSPGQTVRYEVADPDVEFHQPVEPAPVEVGDSALVVHNAGLLTLIQDRGRVGSAQFGVSPSGAFDREAARDANHLVGNSDDAALLEVTLAGATLSARSDQLVAVTGAECELMIFDDVTDPVAPVRNAPFGRGFMLKSGESLWLGSALGGVRSYVAVRGGLDASVTFGSRATDLLSGVGPRPLRNGDVIGVGTRDGGLVRSVEPAVPTIRHAGGRTLDVVLGPRADWFTDDAIQTFLTQAWEVTPSANRIGIRLVGEVALERSITDELPSEGAIVGAIQVPREGQPVIFGPDHPLTGGYPIIAAVADHHLDLLAQLHPGDRVTFRALNEFREF